MTRGRPRLTAPTPRHRMVIILHDLGMSLAGIGRQLGFHRRTALWILDRWAA